MTTLWARMLIFKAWENGQVSEAAAQYFDQMLNNHRFEIKQHSVSSTNFVENQVELMNFNGNDTKCVLGKLGEQKKINKAGGQWKEFSVYRYIQHTSFPNPNNANKMFYMANLIGEDFVGLDNYIIEELAKNKLSAEKWEKIKTYLEDTYEVCAQNNVARKTIVKSLVNSIHLRIQKLNLQEELSYISSAPDTSEESFILNNAYMKELYEEITKIEAAEQEIQITQ